MKKIFLLLVLFYTFGIIYAQNVTTDWTSYTPQELIEDILIDSDCIEDVVVTNVIGGTFGTGDRSYGYFESNGADFPFERGIVLSTGKLINTHGPNTSLSDDDAPDWVGDDDLEDILFESDTYNATIIEFDFTAAATQISFKFLFASEEYQEGSNSTCQYSDLFGFLIRPQSGGAYNNVAVVPYTDIPVKVTTVHPDIPGSGGCEAQNEAYFDSFNDSSAPINFNGQTKVMEAITDVIPGNSYHIKLVIADHFNYRYDSAVYLEAGSFVLTTDLGEDRLVSNSNALCGTETLTLDALQPGNNSYKWFKDGVEDFVNTSSSYTVVEAGTYNVEVTLENNCISYGEILVEYSQNPTVQNAQLFGCDFNEDGITQFNLFDATEDIILSNQELYVVDFFESQQDAEDLVDAILNPTIYTNNTPNQMVYAHVASYTTNCHSIASVELIGTNHDLGIPTQFECSINVQDGIASFDLNAITSSIDSQIPTGADVYYYASENDALNNLNPLSSPFENTVAYQQNIFIKVLDGLQCFALNEIQLEVYIRPVLIDNSEVYYCVDTFPSEIRLNAGVNDNPNNYTYQWFLDGVDLALDTFIISVDQIGVYQVVVTNSNNCSSSRTVVVLPSSSAIIEEIQVFDGGLENTITINVSGEGDYEYAIDGINFQESSTFTNVLPGFYTVYVQDLNGCRISTEEVAVLGFPNFFTPNNDGANDVWQPLGVSSEFNSGVQVQIFDRFGKIIKVISGYEDYWDGTYNGETLPSSDYWYLAETSDGRQISGHFTLKR
ncbi:choice-of-anchor L domain-containing protein [Urechidicola sp. KH5]